MLAHRREHDRLIDRRKDPRRLRCGESARRCTGHFRKVKDSMAKGEKWGLGALSVVQQVEPPIGHALPVVDEATGEIVYEYNGRPLLKVSIQADRTVGYRHGSDGDILSLPFMQQVYVMLGDSAGGHVAAEVTLTLSRDAVVMRPHRARRGPIASGWPSSRRPLLAGGPRCRSPARRPRPDGAGIA